SFLPDGRHFLFTARSNLKENTAIYVGSLDSKETTRLVTEQSNAVFAAPGYLLFGREGTLMAQHFDTTAMKLSGEAFPVAATGDGEEQLVRQGAESTLPGGITAPPFAEKPAGSASIFRNWIAYQSTKSGTREIYARRTDQSEEYRVSASGGAHPRWRSDGRE